MTTTMTLKDQVLTLANRIQTIPTLALIKLLIILVKPVLTHWAIQANAHNEAMSRYPKGSATYKGAEAKYHEAFDNWHRVSFLIMKIEEAAKFQTYARRLVTRPHITPPDSELAQQDAA